MSAVTEQEIVDGIYELARIARAFGYSTTAKYANNLASRIEAHGIAPPDGWVLVPRKPTNEMFRNASVFGKSEAVTTLIWAAMLAAAPEVSE